MNEIALPRLSSSELAALFGDDVAALRRYRLLAALLRGDRTLSEVARAFAVSRESLRRLRRSFVAEGLPSLRSGRRGGGHIAHGSPLARAIREELGSDPSAPPAKLWQRVQQRLAEQGLQTPRSTFYRLLSRMRDESDSESDTRVADRLLREALGVLIEDPPLTLARGALAELLLAEEREPLQRGRQLATALRAAIARTRPEQEIDRDDPRWRHYAILAGEYLEGRERAELEAELALSASTYSRAKREAIERIRALLPAVLHDTSEPDPTALHHAAQTITDLLPLAIARQLTSTQQATALAALEPVVALIDLLRQQTEPM